MRDSWDERYEGGYGFRRALTDTAVGAYLLAHQPPVEQDKPPEERGSYMHPELFGQPEERSLEWVLRPELQRQLKAAREAVPTHPQQGRRHESESVLMAIVVTLLASAVVATGLQADGRDRCQLHKELNSSSYVPGTSPDVPRLDSGNARVQAGPAKARVLGPPTTSGQWGEG